MRPVTSYEYSYYLAQALDDSTKSQHKYNLYHGSSLCLQHWAASLNNGRSGSYDLPPGVIQLIHCLQEKCEDNKSPRTKCFCIKEVLNENKLTEVQYFVTNHIKGQCPHRTYKEKKL